MAGCVTSRPISASCLDSSPAHPRGELIGVTRDITEEVEHAEQEEHAGGAPQHGHRGGEHQLLEVDSKARRFAWIENPLREAYGDPPDRSLDAYIAKLHPEDRRQHRGADRRRARHRQGAHLLSLSHSWRQRPAAHHANACARAGGRGWQPATARRVLGYHQGNRSRRRFCNSRRRRCARWRSDWNVRRCPAPKVTGKRSWCADRMWFSSSYHALLGYEDGELEATPDQVGSAGSSGRSSVVAAKRCCGMWKATRRSTSPCACE